MLAVGVETGVETPKLPGLATASIVGSKGVARMFVRLPGLCPGRVIETHNNSLRNLVRGVAERVLFLRTDEGYVSTPKPKAGYLFSSFSLFYSKLRKVLPSTTPCEIGDFPQFYQGRKRTVYENAVASLMINPLALRDAWLRVFVKWEKLDFTAKGDPAPRIISPRSARFNVMLGRWLRPAEHLLYAGIARVWGDTTVAKGLNGGEVGNLIRDKWERFHHPVAVGLDAKRFDQHVSKQALEWEHMVYNNWMPNTELRWLLRQQLVNTGVGYCPDGKLKYTVEGCRMSGDMNTSSGNCLLMCAMVWTYCADRHITAKLINNGDDCVVFMEQASLATFQDGLREQFLKWGFDMKVEAPVYEIEKIEFCQAHPIFVGDHNYVMVRNLEAALSKDSVALIQAQNKRSVVSWCAAVGDAGTALYGGIPILGAMSEAFARQGSVNGKWAKTYERSGRDYLARGMTRRGLPILDVTRLSYYVAFGVLPDEQLQFERYFGTWGVKVMVPSLTNELSPQLKPSFVHLVNHALSGKPTS